jgi:hypothetical protein
VFSVLLYGFGRLVTLVTSKFEGRYKPSTLLLPPESNTAGIDQWVIRAAAWGVLVASGTFCGFLVVASVAAGAFAVRQLKKSGVCA